MVLEDIRDKLFEICDAKYCLFQRKLIPTVKQENIIGVRTPDLRSLSRELSKRSDINIFLDSLPHRYFEENQVHAFIIAGIRDYDECIKRLDAFLPFVDNWATCDQMLPKVFGKHRANLIIDISRWIKSKDVYTVRFAIGMLKNHFLDDEFLPKYACMVAQVASNEYYINMMVAWYFATALAKQYDSALPFIVDSRLNEWTHNKTIQKAIESNRLTKEQKEYLRSLKRR